ncbi:olfactory receptor 6F1-like [Pleurodeles waltl]|uniref:olfactory receptor 6F1-like n=1 Tax=Pleurodeles waltl TaxID=8319 RepID=UPI003709A6B6
MERTACSKNLTISAEFSLRGFDVLPELRPLLFLFFLTIYIFTIAGNTLILIMVTVEHQLHLPMYFFLGNLSFLEIWCPTTTVPTMLSCILFGSNTMSLTACIIQLYFFGWLVITECFLLTLMAYDRYVAICYPLHYNTLMGKPQCWKMVFGAWLFSFAIVLGSNILLCNLQFLKHNEIDHFFCDFAPFLKAACSDTTIIEMEAFILSFIGLSIPFLLIIISYVYIISSILRIPSTVGRRKAFSTCTSHVAVVVTYFGTLIAMYVVPAASHSLNLSKAVSLLYSVATPLCNPVIYTLRNKEIIESLKKISSMKQFSIRI